MEEADYIKTNVGKPLQEAVAQACLQRPNDPIQFVAHHLLKHLSVTNVNNARPGVEAALSAELAANEELQKHNTEAAAALQSAQDCAIQSINDAKTKDEAIQAAISAAKQLFSSENVYIAVFEKAPPKRVVNEDGEETFEEEVEPEPEPEPEGEDGEGEDVGEGEEANDAEPVQQAEGEGEPAEGTEGEEKPAPPPKPKKLPRIPKTFWLRYIATSDSQVSLVGTGIRRSQHPVSFQAIDSRGSIVVPSVVQSDVKCFGMPLPGSLAISSLKGPDEGIIGAIAVDCLGTNTRYKPEDNEKMQRIADSFSPKMFELYVEVERRTNENKAAVSALVDSVAEPDDQKVGEEDDAAAIDAKVDAGAERLTAAKALFTDKFDVEKLGEILSAESAPANNALHRGIVAMVCLVKGTKESPLHDKTLDSDWAALKEVCGEEPAAGLIEAWTGFDVKAKRVKKSFEAARSIIGDLSPTNIVDDTADCVLAAHVLASLCVVLEQSDKNCVARRKEAGDDNALVEDDIEAEEAAAAAVEEEAKRKAEEEAAAAENNEANAEGEEAKGEEKAQEEAQPE